MPAGSRLCPTLENVRPESLFQRGATLHRRLIRVQMKCIPIDSRNRICSRQKSGGPALADTLEQSMKNFELDSVAGHLIRRCQQRAVDLFCEEVGENGPNPRQFAVLISVFQNPGLSQTALVEASGIDRSTLTEVLRRMVDRGMISRSRTPADQRANALFLTEEGRLALESAFEAADRAQRRILAPVPEADRATAINILSALAGYEINPHDNKSVSCNPASEEISRD